MRTLNDNVHVQSVWKYGLFGRTARKKPLFCLKNTNMAPLETFGHNAKHHIWQKPNTAYPPKHLMPTLSSIGGVLILTCFATAGPGHLAVTESTMNISVYQGNLEPNVRPSVWQLKLGWYWLTKSPTGWLKKKRIPVLWCSRPQPDWNVVLGP